jgi:hypothetical protein
MPIRRARLWLRPLMSLNGRWLVGKSLILTSVVVAADNEP